MPARAIESRFPEYTCAASLESDYLCIERGGQEIEYVPGVSDLANALFIIWCLDRLEELEYLNLRLIYNGLGRINPDGSKVARYYISVGAWSEINKPFAEGDTRAEACAQALLAALTSLSEEENKS